MVSRLTAAHRLLLAFFFAGSPLECPRAFQEAKGRMSQATSILFQQQEEQGIHVIRLAFRMLADGVTLDTLNSDLAAAIVADPEGDWIIDIAQVEICSSALLGVLVNAMNLIRKAKGRLVLAGPSPAIQRSIHACSLQRLFTMTASKGEAHERFR
jgi:anti-anti-sigma factor